MRRFSPALVFAATATRRAAATEATPGKVRVTFVTLDGTRVAISATEGMTLMEAGRDVAKLDIEAACDGTCACSTCHVYLRDADFARVAAAQGEPSEDELDMLDLAPRPRPTSRLSCQVKLVASLDDIEATIPPEHSNQLR